MTKSVGLMVSTFDPRGSLYQSEQTDCFVQNDHFSNGGFMHILNACDAKREFGKALQESVWVQEF